MFQPTKIYYTPEEYLALEDGSESKSEYYKGQIYAMAGGSARHSQICVNISTALNLKLRNRPCSVFNSDLKVQVSASGFYTYPDTTVVCGEVEFFKNEEGNLRHDIITNPILLVEVLSPSTESYDRKDKFVLYRALTSLQHYLLIDQECYAVDHYQRTNQGWLLRSYLQPNDSLTLHLSGGRFKLTLASIYSKVKFD
ncbi:MAG: Uma2 family endonuclease [Chloroflexota bacterium]|nr:Uma2 family endonuclease [Chloroflexota bacterium]